MNVVLDIVPPGARPGPPSEGRTSFCSRRRTSEGGLNEVKFAYNLSHNSCFSYLHRSQKEYNGLNLSLATMAKLYLF